MSSKMSSQTWEVTSRSVEETKQLGMRLGQRLGAGDVIGLMGELGSGKTTFIQGIAEGLAIDPAQVKSPTFILLREYPGRIPLIHMDAYRLDNEASVVWMDVDWVFSPTKITVIEWADRVTGCLPDDRLEIRLTHKRTNLRAIRAVGHGPRSQQLIADLEATSHARAGD